MEFSELNASLTLAERMNAQLSAAEALQRASRRAEGFFRLGAFDEMVIRLVKNCTAGIESIAHAERAFMNAYRTPAVAIVEHMQDQLSWLPGIHAQVQRAVFDANALFQTTFSRSMEIDRAIQSTVVIRDSIFREIRNFQEFQEWSEAHTLESVNGRAEEFDLMPLHQFLLDRCWALPLDASLRFVFLLSDMLEFGEAAEIEPKLCDYYSSQLDEIEEFLVAQFPTRSRFLIEAFRAHRRGEFSLSVTAFLPQIDGIWHDLTCDEQHFFQRRGKKKVRRLLGTADERTDIILLTVVDPGMIRAHSKQVRDRPEILCRSAILHGLSLDFATERNSLRCISWLCLLTSLSRLRDDRRTESSSS